jgi:hypothetical protein
MHSKQNEYQNIDNYLKNKYFQNKIEQQKLTNCSIKYFRQKISITLKISFQWFIYVFHLYKQPIFFNENSIGR